MTKRHNRILASALLALTLAGCAPQYTIPEASCPTLPSFSQDLTPLQQLQSAIAETRQAVPFTVCYGTITGSGEEAVEDRQSQAVTATAEFDRDAMYSAVPLLPSNDGFLQAFCSMPLRAIPSNTGTICYQLTDLTWADAAALLYSQPPANEFALCSIALEIDDGRFAALEIVFSSENTELTVFLNVTFPETP